MSIKAFISTKFKIPYFFNEPEVHIRASVSKGSTEQQSFRPTATAAAAATAHDVKNKCYILLFIMILLILATVIIFAVVAVKVRTPKFRLGEAKLINYIVQPSALRATLNAEFTVKNTNFGPYNYGSTTVDFFYRGAKIGEIFVPSSKAGWRSTKKIWGDVDVELALSSNPQLSGDYSAGLVPITSSAKMSGRVEMLVTKKSRLSDMNCSMYIVTATQTVWNIVCE